MILRIRDESDQEAAAKFLGQTIANALSYSWGRFPTNGKSFTENSQQHQDAMFVLVVETIWKD